MTDLDESSATLPRVVWIPVVIAFMVFLPALSNRFVWDDHLLVLGAPFFHTPSMWAQSLGEPLIFSPNHFQPVALLSLILDVRIAGTSPTPYHFTNLILHLVNTLLVTILAAHVYRESVKDPSSGTRLHDDAMLVPVGAGVLYGLHPAVVEAVSFVSCRSDLLMTTFLLLALLADETLQRRSILRPLGVALAFLLAMLASEMAAGFILVYAAWQFVRGRARLWPVGECWSKAREHGSLAVTAALLVAGGLYLYLRHKVLGQLYLSDPGLESIAGSSMQHVLLVARSLAEYLLVLAWPFGTLGPIHHNTLPIPLGDATARAALLLAILAVVGSVLVVRRAPLRGGLLVAGLLSLLPALHVFPMHLRGGGYIAERFLMFPLAFFALFAIGFVRTNSAQASRRLRLALAATWALACVVSVGRTVPHWRDDTALWAWAIQRAPLSEVPSTHLAEVYNNNGDPRRGLKAAYKALDLNAMNPRAWNHAGVALHALALHEQAAQAFEQAATMDATNPTYWSNLATALVPLGRLDEAERIVTRQTLKMNPEFAEGYVVLGAISLERGRPDLAVRHFRQGLNFLPPGEAFLTRRGMAQVQEPHRWVELALRFVAEANLEGAQSALSQARRLGAGAEDLARIESAFSGAIPR
ncbi:MAG: tetratricopeptide repeat protein [Verrucomicrobia bacterium]|nr:tetratricopeptide repeat protein [Verrucomicrobiota bacterium]